MELVQLGQTSVRERIWQDPGIQSRPELEIGIRSSPDGVQQILGAHRQSKASDRPSRPFALAATEAHTSATEQFSESQRPSLQRAMDSQK